MMKPLPTPPVLEFNKLVETWDAYTGLDWLDVSGIYADMLRRKAPKTAARFKFLALGLGYTFPAMPVTGETSCAPGRDFPASVPEAERGDI